MGDFVLDSPESDGRSAGRPSTASSESGASSEDSRPSSSASRPSSKPKSWDEGSRPSSPGSGGDRSAGEDEEELAVGELGEKGAGKGKKGGDDAKGKGGPGGAGGLLGAAVGGGLGRNQYASEPFGRSRLTPKYKHLEAEPFSYQMTCGFRGHVSCTRTLSVAKAGGAQTCLRMLKQWAVQPILDPTIVDKPAHKADDEWLKIEEARVAGTLRPEEELERLAVESSWGWT